MGFAPPLRTRRTPRTERGGVAGRSRAVGFTLVEVIVSMAVLLLLMVLLVQMFSGVSSAWTSNTARVGAFTAARSAFEAMGRNLSQATLNTYLGYADAAGQPVPLVNPSLKLNDLSVRARIPVQYLRASELHFLTDQTSRIFGGAGVTGLSTVGQGVFFQSNTGFASKLDDQPEQSLLNALGYYIEFGADGAFRADVATGRTVDRYRYRLMEVIQPAEYNAVYHSTDQTDPSTGLPVYSYNLDWVSAALKGYPPSSTTPVSTRHPLAENIIALALLPKLSTLQGTGATTPLTTDYSYDSRRWEKPGQGTADKRWRNQLPPIITLTVVAVDEPSALRMSKLYGGADGTQPPLSDETLRGQIKMETLFQDPGKLNDDISTLSKALASLHLNYRVFQADITMHGSQWSNE